MTWGYLLLACLVVFLGGWWINKNAPTDPPIRQIGLTVLTVIVVLFVLWVLGFGGFMSRPIR